jgi:hypothetical protein
MVQALYISPGPRQSSTVFPVVCAGKMPYYRKSKILRNLPVRKNHQAVWHSKIWFTQGGIAIRGHMECREGPLQGRLGIVCSESVWAFLTYSHFHDFIQLILYSPNQVEGG